MNTQAYKRHLPGRQLQSLRQSVHKKRNICVTVKADKGKERQPWDIGRFLNTIFFFNKPPSPVDFFKNLLQQPSEPEQASSGPLMRLAMKSTTAAVQPKPVDGIVLVTGATGGVGKRVVARLLASGAHVRALVRDLEKAKELLSSLPVAPGGVLEVAAADITQRATLLPEMVAGVRAVVSATAVKVAPKEGDTVSRSKYYQGIKFYDPEIVGDTPETVECKGLQNVLEAVKGSLGVVKGQTVLAAGKDASFPSWGSLDDVVMGGVSTSTVEEVAGAGEGGAPAMVFRGVVSTDNSGGFASVRSRNWEPPLDASPYAGLELRVRGNGLRYKAIIRTDSNWDGVGYCRSFDTPQGEWTTIRLPFSDFIPVFRARTLRDGTRLDPSRISSVQLMLSKFEYDGQLSPAFRAGPFELPIAHIRTYLPDPVTPRFVHVSSAGVTRPNRPGINVDMEPPAVKLNDALGGLLTWKLAGEDAVRASGVPAAIVRPTALTEEPAGAPLEVDQGDVIKGKISREDVAELCVALLTIPDAAGATFEIKSTVPFSTPWVPDTSSAQPRDWKALIQSAGIQPGVTGKTINGVYSGKNKEEELLKLAPVSVS